LRSIPTLAIRGALSDLLSPHVFERMRREKPDLHQLTVPNRGHAPLLHEPQCQEAIDRFLASIP
jgi:pimeloyl-ACP methyl ester carboxylesterase